jgi:hypothetical protein
VNFVERTESVVDRGGEVSGGFVASVGGQVLPPDGVVDVAAEVEREVLLVQEDRSVVTVGARLIELGDRVVEALDVGGVMLAVVNLVDLTGDMRFERAVVVVEVRQGVLGHENPF